MFKTDKEDQIRNSLPKCCNGFNPNVKGYLWSKLFPVRLCSNCGKLHFLFGRKKTNFILFLSNRTSIKDVRYHFPNASKWHQSTLENLGLKVTPGNKNPQYLHTIVWDVLVNHYFKRLKDGLQKALKAFGQVSQVL